MNVPPSNRLFQLLLLFAAGTLLLLPNSACNSDNEPSSTALHGCELFEVDEIEGILGSTVDSPPRETHRVDEENGFWMSMCNYFAPEPGTSLGIMVQPIQPRGNPQKAYQIYVDSLKESFPELTPVEVEGLGDKAMWNAETGQLTIFSERYLVLVTSMKPGAPDEEKLALAREIGQRTLNKLP